MEPDQMKKWLDYFYYALTVTESQALPGTLTFALCDDYACWTVTNHLTGI